MAETTETINISKIILVYENGTQISVNGERAQKIAASFFSSDPDIELTDWTIEKPSVGIVTIKKPLLKRIDESIMNIFKKTIK